MIFSCIGVGWAAQRRPPTRHVVTTSDHRHPAVSLFVCYRRRVADAGFIGGVLVGSVVTAVTVGPLCWTAAKFDRALADRRDAWATHKALLGTLWSYGGRVIVLSLAALTVLGLVIASQAGSSGEAGTVPSSPGVSSSTQAR